MDFNSKWTDCKLLVAKNITVLQLFISRMPKMCAIPQLVSAPLNPKLQFTNILNS